MKIALILLVIIGSDNQYKTVDIKPFSLLTPHLSCSYTPRTPLGIAGQKPSLDFGPKSQSHLVLGSFASETSSFHLDRSSAADSQNHKRSLPCCAKHVMRIVFRETVGSSVYAGNTKKQNVAYVVSFREGVHSVFPVHMTKMLPGGKQSRHPSFLIRIMSMCRSNFVRKNSLNPSITSTAPPKLFFARSCWLWKLFGEGLKKIQTLRRLEAEGTHRLKKQLNLNITLSTCGAFSSGNAPHFF